MIGLKRLTLPLYLTDVLWVMLIFIINSHIDIIFIINDNCLNLNHSFDFEEITLIAKNLSTLALKIFLLNLLLISLLACDTESAKDTSAQKQTSEVTQIPSSAVEDEQGNTPTDNDNNNYNERANLQKNTIKREFSGQVIAVTDGDTIEVLENNNQVKIRLAEIDCPESTQDFGQKAKQFTFELVMDEQVKVKVKDIDRYGRSVAEVILPDGRSLNRDLVKAGLAWWYQRYSSDETLGQLQEEAKGAKLGLWSSDSPVPPWDFRHHRR